MLDKMPPIDATKDEVKDFIKHFARDPVGRGMLPKPIRLRDWRKHFKEDYDHLRSGVLDLRSFIAGYLPQYNPIEVVNNYTDLLTGEKRLRIIRAHNLRVTMGRDQIQRLQIAGNITANASSYTGVSGSATATSNTSLTNSGAAFPTSGGPNGSLQGQIVVAQTTHNGFGVILSNTATVLTIDQWYDPTSASGAALATAPSSTTTYTILPFAGFCNWIGLSTSAAAPAAGDVLRTADGLYGDGTTTGTATEQNANGLARAFVQPTFPGAGQIQLQNTFTYTGSGSVSCPKVVLCNSKAAAGSLLFLETLLNAAAAFNLSGDNAQVTWTINL